MVDKIRTIIAGILDVDPSTVGPDTVIGDLPEWDSLHHLRILVALQEEFGVKYAAADLAELEDVSDLANLTEELVG